MDGWMDGWMDGKMHSMVECRHVWTVWTVRTGRAQPAPAPRSMPGPAARRPQALEIFGEQASTQEPDGPRGGD